jgi:hypothetical protein
MPQALFLSFLRRDFFMAVDECGWFIVFLLGLEI